jgi:outer membrane protein TolC
MVLLGCAAGPDFQPPRTPAASAYTSVPLPAETQQSPGMAGNSQSLILGEQIPAQWWRLFQSTDLDHMIRLAMADNPTILAAQAALLQARENLRVQFGATWFPGIDANLSAVRQRTSGAAFGQAGGGTIFELYNT